MFTSNDILKADKMLKKLKLMGGIKPKQEIYIIKALVVIRCFL